MKVGRQVSSLGAALGVIAMLVAPMAGSTTNPDRAQEMVYKECLFFWKDYAGKLDGLTQAYKAEFGYYGPRDPNPNTAYYKDANGNWSTAYYVYHNGNCSETNAERTEACAQEVQQRWLVQGNEWASWYVSCVMDDPEQG